MDHKYYLLRMEELKYQRRVNDELVSTIYKLTQALKHYANENNWDVVDGSCSRDFQNWRNETHRCLDFGHTARKALKGIFKETNDE